MWQNLYRAVYRLIWRPINVPVPTGVIVPPVPPGPFDRLLAENNSLDSYSTPYNSPTGHMVVRIIARNNAASLPGLTATWAGTPMTVAAEVCDGTVGAPVAFLAAIRNGTIGAGTLAIACTTGSAGFAAVRIGDIASWPGPALFGDIKGATGIDPNGLFDLQFAPVAPGAGDMAQLAGWMDERCYPITQYYGATTQWTTQQWQVGPELVTNGDFSVGTGWTLGTGWSITGGQAVHAGGFGNFRQNIAITPNGRYQASYEVVSTNTVSLPMWAIGGITQGIPPTQSTPGVYSYATIAPSSVTGYGAASSDGSTVIDNLSLKAITSGMTAWFGRQVTPAAGQYTYEASNNGSGAKGVALIVELRGAVPP